MFWGVNGKAPGSWKMMVTMSFPTCLFLSSWMGNRSYHSDQDSHHSAHLTKKLVTVSAVK